MSQVLTYKYQIKGKRSVRRLRRHAWAVNQAWNFCVATQRETQKRWRDSAKARWLSAYDLEKLSSGTSKALGIHSDSIAKACHQFARSRDQHKQCPAFRRSGGARRSLGWIPFKDDNRRIVGNAVTYFGNTFRFFMSRPLPATVRGGCFAEDARGRWWVCFQVEISEQQPTGSGAVGLDLGLKNLATTSDGTRVEALRAFRALETKLATAQRAGNRRRAKAIHEKIKNTRRDSLHKASATLARDNKLIVVGNVSSSKLARTSMAKSVHDAGWSTFRNMLRYKASRHGATYLEVDESFTTQTCSACGCVPSSRPQGIAGLGIREWVCSDCGVRHDRDVNAARNILAIGLGAQPRVDESRVAYGR